MANEKQTYSTPKLIVHGTVEKLTLQAGQENADTPKGTPNTAYSVRR